MGEERGGGLHMRWWTSGKGMGWLEMHLSVAQPIPLLAKEEEDIEMEY